jgi:sigma-B regulation protein RsbU (phosphoserine phosphatase)
MQTQVDGTFTRVNRLFCTWVGHSPESLIGQRRFQDLLTVGGRIFHQTHWAPLLQMQGSISEVKLELVHSDGSTIPMVLNALVRQQDGHGVHELAAYIARDRDKYERELVLSRKRLEAMVAEAADRAVFAEQMVGIVSHDLRNPLAGIQMAAALLARGGLSESQQRVVTRISRATGRASNLIADLLDFTQARLGKGLPVALAAIDLHEVIAEMVEDLALAHPGRIVRHQRSGAGPCLGDGARLSQLVGNLVSNALAYGEPDQPITVTSAIEDARFSLAVHNLGPPIPVAAQARLFQPMTRGTQPSGSGRSVGLGLFIVNEIARAHGGRAVVRSTQEEGTTFSAVFPRGT